MTDSETPRPLRVLAFAGSLRAASYTRMPLRAAVELAPAGMEIEIVDIDGIPLFNEGVRATPPPNQAAGRPRQS